MMLFKDNKVYVNKSDLRFMLQNYKLLDIPDMIPNSLFCISNKRCMVNSEQVDEPMEFSGMVFSAETDNEWVGFEDEKCIEYFEKSPYMIDYDEYFNMSDEQIENELLRISIRREVLQSYYNDLKARGKDLKVANYNATMEMLGHEFDDIVKMHNIRNNFVKLELPNEDTPIAIAPVTDEGLIGPVKVAKKDMKHVWFAEKVVFNFNAQDIYRHTNIR